MMKLQCPLPIMQVGLYNHLFELSCIRVVSYYTSNWKLWISLHTTSFFYQLPLLVSLQCRHLNMAIIEICGNFEKLVSNQRLFRLDCSLLVFVVTIYMGQSKYFDILSCFILSREFTNVKNCLWLAQTIFFPTSALYSKLAESRETICEEFNICLTFIAFLKRKRERVSQQWALNIVITVTDSSYSECKRRCTRGVFPTLSHPKISSRAMYPEPHPYNFYGFLMEDVCRLCD